MYSENGVKPFFQHMNLGFFFHGVSSEGKNVISNATSSLEMCSWHVSLIIFAKSIIAMSCIFLMHRSVAKSRRHDEMISIEPRHVTRLPHK